MSTSRHPSEAPARAGSAAPRAALAGFEERLLADLKIAVAEQASAGHAPAARRTLHVPRPGPRPARRLALAAAAFTVLAAGVAIALAMATVTPHSRVAPHSQEPTANPAAARPGASFVPATTAAGVLHNAALAALEQPAGAPRPGQFVYTKVYRYQQMQGGGVLQTWLSADGVQAGLQSGGTPGSTAYSPGCRDGRYFYPGSRPSSARCNAAQNAAYFPGMPTSPGALRTWLQRHFGIGPGYASGLLTNTEAMLTTDYLLPRQEAALYEVLAQTPGLTVVPKATNVRGVTGVGIRTDVADKGSIYTIIFDPRTYAPLGMIWSGTDWTSSGPVTTTRNGEVLLDRAIVDKLGQRP